MEINAGDFTSMSVRHGCKCIPDPAVTVEDCLLAVSAVIGGANISSASRMNKAVVFFLKEVQMVDTLIENGLTINDTFVLVLPLSSSTKKVVLSNVPPFVRSEKLEEILKRHGKLMSPIKMIPLGCKNAELKHVMSFRRQVIMILNSQTEALNFSVRMSIDGKDYTIFISSETMRCFTCGGVGHVRQTCPNKNRVNVNGVAAAAANAENDGQVRGNDLNTASVSSELSVVENAELNTSREDSGVAGGLGHDSVESVEETAVSSVENRVLQSVPGPSGVQTDNDCNSHSEIKQTQLPKITENIEEPIEEESSQDISVYPQTEESDNDYEDSESIVDENNETGASVQMQITGGESKLKLYSLKQINDFLDCTKGLRKPKIETFFPDLNLFLESGTTVMRKASFDEFDKPKRYRLKKILCNVRSSLVRGKK